MLDPSLGVPAVGLLLAVAASVQVLAEFTQARKGGTRMTKNLRVIYSSLMVTVSSVLINLAAASSAPSGGLMPNVMMIRALQLRLRFEHFRRSHADPA